MTTHQVDKITYHLINRFDVVERMRCKREIECAVKFKQSLFDRTRNDAHVRDPHLIQFVFQNAAHIQRGFGRDKLLDDMRERHGERAAPRPDFEHARSVFTHASRRGNTRAT